MLHIALGMAHIPLIYRAWTVYQLHSAQERETWINTTATKSTIRGVILLAHMYLRQTCCEHKACLESSSREQKQKRGRRISELMTMLIFDECQH